MKKKKKHKQTKKEKNPYYGVLHSRVKRKTDN